MPASSLTKQKSKHTRRGVSHTERQRWWEEKGKMCRACLGDGEGAGRAEGEGTALSAAVRCAVRERNVRDSVWGARACDWRRAAGLSPLSH